jgi:glycosidase
MKKILSIIGLCTLIGNTAIAQKKAPVAVKSTTTAVRKVVTTGVNKPTTIPTRSSAVAQKPVSAAVLNNLPDAWITPNWARNAAIYEVNVRQFSASGKFNEVEQRLESLRTMGVSIVWLMPIFPIGEQNRKGKLGSYYAVKDYRAVNPEYGTMDDFKSLVNKAHQLGMKVILDWVANHSAPDNKLVAEHPDWYNHDLKGNVVPPVADWTDVADFNYDKKELWNYQIESMRYWIQQADVDGFRCDVAMMVPLEFWRQARIQLDKTKKVFMLAEAEGPEYYRNGFDMTYGWEFHGVLNKVAKGEMHASDLYRYFDDTTKYRRTDIRMYFTSNHDENSWNGTEYERMGAAAQAMAVIAATVPGMPLVYTGQEIPLKRRLRFFDKDTIDMMKRELAPFYDKLLNSRKLRTALWSDPERNMSMLTAGNPSVFAMMRETGNSKVMVIVNCSNKPTQYKLDLPPLMGLYNDLFTNQMVDAKDVPAGNLAPWGYKVYVK